MKVRVDLGSRSYDIIIQAGALDHFASCMEEYGLNPPKGLLVTDDRVDPLHAGPAQKQLIHRGMHYPRSVVPSGEESKSKDWLFHIYQDALEAGLDRRSVMVAIGGGVVGDLGGYAAASFLRGIRYVQVPTTLLSMVDSAVGGKTGINLPQGKNLIGAFHQPSLVICDLNTLKTLPAREFRSGLAEIIKYGIIYDPELFSYCEQHMTEALAADPAVLAHLVSRSCMIKAEVVSQDETETGLRAILNFGHTLGHAIEAVAGYGTYLHGEAIAVGMVFAARLSTKLTGLSREEAERIERLFVQAKLPVNARGMSWTSLRKAMEVDKKSTGGSPRFVLARSIGVVEPGIPVEESVLKETWDSL